MAMNRRMSVYITAVLIVTAFIAGTVLGGSSSGIMERIRAGLGLHAIEETDGSSGQDDNEDGNADGNPALLSEPSGNVRVPILYYHAVDDETFGLEQLFVRPDEFDRQMEYVSKNYTPIYFSQIPEAGRIKNPIIITFDDGYRDNYTYAYPILKKYNVKATVFLVPEYLDKPKFLTREQVSVMKDLVSFQSHTMNHMELDKASETLIRKQLIDSKSYIERLTGERVNVLAYPVGLYNDEVVRITGEYYDYAVTSESGYYYTDGDRYRIRRVYIRRDDRMDTFISKVEGSYYKE